MAKRLVVVAVLTCIVTALEAQSPPQPPSPTVTTKIEQNQGHVENTQPQYTNSPSQISPTLINQTATGPTQKNANYEREVSKRAAPFNWSRLNTFLLTLFTGILAVVGVLQWRSMGKQARYMRDGLKSTETSAEAAKESAAAATATIAHAKSTTEKTERAFVLVESVVVGNRTGEGSQLESHNLIMFTLKNFGTTIASLVKLSGMICGICQWPFPDIPTTSIAPQGVFSWVTTQSIGAFIPDDSLRRINSRHAWLEFKIKITYVDAFERGHTYLCEGRYEPALKQFLTISSSSD